MLDLLPEQCRKALPGLVDYTGHGVDQDFILSWTRETIHRPFFERWPAMQGARLFFGLGDGACANVGSKCTTVHRVACTIGTSAAARVCLPFPINDVPSQPLVRAGLFCYRISSSYVLVGGALTDGGSVVEWIAQLLQLGSVSSTDFQSCLEKASQLPPEKKLPSVVPFLSGERSTGYRTGATGSIIGLTRETKPEHLLRGCLEGVTLRINAIVKLIRQAIGDIQGNGDRPIRIVCSGKALEGNQLWRQMLADCTGYEIVMDKTTHEGTSRGVAVLLCMGLNEEHHFRTEVLNDNDTAVPSRNDTWYWNRATHSQEQLINCISVIYQEES